MKILLCNKFFRPVGGPESIVFDLMGRLEAMGHNTVVFSMEHPQNWFSPHSNLFMPNVDLSGKSEYGLLRKVKEAGRIIYSFPARRKIEQLIRETRPDVAHLHNIYHQLSPSIIHSLVKYKIPIVMTLHDYRIMCPAQLMLVNGQVCEKCMGGRFHHAVTGRCVDGSLANSVVCGIESYLHYFLGTYKHVDIFVSPSQFLKDKMVKFGFPERQIVVQHNAAESSRFNTSAEGKHVLYMGKIVNFKGVMTLAKAAAHLPDVTFAFVGDGDGYDELENFVKNNNLKNVQLLGFKWGEELRKILEESLAVVVPSEWYENCPMVVLEAFACAKPVVGSRIGGIPELIKDGVDGYLFEPGNAEDLAAKLRTLLADDRLRIKMGLTGLDKTRKEFSHNGFFEETLRIYQKAIDISKRNT
jgi:glycosyltransferase involved in cell wall biosynthesis